MVKTPTITVALNVRCLRPAVRKSFHKWCRDRGASMEHALRQIIEAIATGDFKPSVSQEYAAVDGNAAINIRCLHFNVRRHFKSWCVLQGVSMEHALRQIIEAIVVGTLNPKIAPDR